MTNLLALLCLVDWLANDLHYKSVGPGFYEKHLLADRVRDFGDADDQIKENYFLGFRGEFPPADLEIAQKTILAYQRIINSSANTSLAQLAMVFKFIVEEVEKCKQEPGLPSGIQATLDEISQKALSYKFLVTAEQ